MGVPFVTLRTTVERPKSANAGTKEMLGTDPTALTPAIEWVREAVRKHRPVPPP
jgi:hypothetical protein